MKLVIDLGNTFQKLAVYSDDFMVHSEIPTEVTPAVLARIFTSFPISSTIMSSVINHDSELEDFILSHCDFINFNHNTPLPIINKYQTLETLGKDRLASAVAAHQLFPDKDVLVIDAGTCVKFDFINSMAEYLGGSISPGLQMRFRALHSFTEKLPFVELKPFDILIGKTTHESLLSGVINGTLAEIDGIINRYKENYPELQVVLSGGDAEYLVSKLKNRIFALSNIVLNGLKIILDYNDNQKLH